MQQQQRQRHQPSTRTTRVPHLTSVVIMGSQDQHPRDGFLNGDHRATRQGPEFCVPEQEGGACETATRAEIAALTGPVSPALAATAVHLARHLDKGAGLATAAVARELRATITALTVGGGDEEDGTQRLLERISGPAVLDGPQPAPSNVRAEGGGGGPGAGEAVDAVATARRRRRP
jgi:hypothetical protein